MAKLNTLENPIHFHVPIPTKTRNAITELAAKDGLSSSALARRILSDYVSNAGENAFAGRLETIELAVTKVAKRVDGVVGILRSIEMDEVERRAQERKAFQSANEDNLRTIGEVVATNSAAIQALAARIEGFEDLMKPAVEQLQNRLALQGKLVGAILLGTSDRSIRQAYREIETGTSGGKSIGHYLGAALNSDFRGRSLPNLTA